MRLALFGSGDGPLAAVWGRRGSVRGLWADCLLKLVKLFGRRGASSRTDEQLAHTSLTILSLFPGAR